MSTPFCPGYGEAPFRQLVEDCPGADVYPRADFRTEWGPVFHRGRLDGSARLLVLGQDPAQHETIARRILMGVAGRRVQGFLAKLGLDAGGAAEGAYVMINTFAYSVYGQQGGARHVRDAAIAAYRERWIAALLDGGAVRGVVAFGGLADEAWRHWAASPAAQGRPAVTYRHLSHPTFPEAAGGDVAATTKTMLAAWSTALRALAPVVAPGTQPTDVVAYGDAFTDADQPPIPPRDLAAGSPAWIGLSGNWAVRDGATAAEKRLNIRVTAVMAP